MDKQTEIQIYIDEIEKYKFEVKMLNKEIDELLEELNEERAERLRYQGAFSTLVEELRIRLT